MSLGMSKLEARYQAKGRGHHAVSRPVPRSGADGEAPRMRRVAGVALPAPSVGLGVSIGLPLNNFLNGLGLPLVGLEAVGQVAVGLGRVAWEDTGLMHDLAARSAHLHEHTRSRTQSGRGARGRGHTSPRRSRDISEGQSTLLSIYETENLHFCLK